MSTEVAVLATKEVAITNEQKELIRKTICKDATDAEMQLFFFDCQRRGTHPLDKLIHFTKRDGKYTPVTSIDFFRLRAHSSGAYAGEGATTYQLGEDGLPNECTVAVLRLVQGQLCTWRATARWDEYYPGEKSGFMWRKMPFLMLAKCAEALALRKAFPAELQGLYVKEEMDQAGMEPPAYSKSAKECEGHPVGQSHPPSSVLEPSAEEALSEMAAQSQTPPQDNLFDASSAQAEHEQALKECEMPTDKHQAIDALQKAWDDTVKDKRLSSETRPHLYQLMKQIEKKIRARK